jgi:hypothetical protein
MSLKHIRTAVDPDLFMKGDVFIVKRTYANSNGRGKHETICTRCEKPFPTQYRRMGRFGTARACEVRNIPQCPPCRGRYVREARLEKKLSGLTQNILPPHLEAQS